MPKERTAAALEPLAELLRATRKAQELSADRLSKSVSFSASQVYRWESGRQVPHLDSLVEWANSLGYEVTLRKIEGDDE